MAGDAVMSVWPGVAQAIDALALREAMEGGIAGWMPAITLPRGALTAGLWQKISAARASNLRWRRSAHRESLSPPRRWAPFLTG